MAFKSRNHLINNEFFLPSISCNLTLKEKSASQQYNWNQLASMVPKLWASRVIVIHVENMLKTEIQLNLISLKQKYILNANYLSYIDSQYIKFFSKTWDCHCSSKDLFPFTTINNFILCLLLNDKNYRDHD